MKFSAQEPGIFLSGATHVALIFWGLFAMSSPKPFDEFAEAVPVDVISDSQFREMTKGDPKEKQVKPDTPVRVDRIAKVEEQKDPGKEKKDVPTPPPPPLRPVIKQAEDDLDEDKPTPPKPAVVPPPPKLAKVEPPKPEPQKPLPKPEPAKAEPKPAKPDPEEEEDKEAEIIRQRQIKQKLEQQKAEEARKADEKKKAEDKRLADEKLKADQKRQADLAKAAAEKEAAQEAAREAAKEAAEEAAEAKKLADEKRKAEAAKKLAEDNKKAAEAARKLAEAKKADEARKAAEKAESDKLSASIRNRLLASREAPSSSGSTGAKLSASASAGAPNATGQKLSPSDREQLMGMIKEQMERCWSVTATSVPAVKPTVRLQLGQNGAIIAQPVLTNSSGDPSFNAIADSGMRAIRQCAPYRIPAKFADKYDDWKTITVRLDPTDLL